MDNKTDFFINGEWVAPSEGAGSCTVINPANEKEIARISLGGIADVDKAVAAARAAFPAFSKTSREDRLALLDKIIALYKSRLPEMAKAISQEMGAPMKLAMTVQAPSGLGHFITARKILADFDFEESLGSTQVFKEPIGVCGLITPWNWPVNQIACKVAPALATGCTMVLKPSEVAPLSAYLLAEILQEAGVPQGVFNLVNGDGPTVGAALSSHPDVDMMSFTGSTRAGIEVARAAAPTVKRVAQELGGKSANIILEDADMAKAVTKGVLQCFHNTGQSCNAPTRMLVPKHRLDEVIKIAKDATARIAVGDPVDESKNMGPVVSAVQYEKIQGLIEKGMDEATLIVGGTGKPAGLEKGYYVKPTIFAHVNNDMVIAREEIFGPVLCILAYESEEEAIKIANDTPYGLSGYVSGELDHARAVARELRTGMVHLNGAATDINAPFGGYKQSGNGREWGHAGFEDFLETKAVMGHNILSE